MNKKLEKHWWHRLAKVVFVVLVLVIAFFGAAGGALVFYEEKNTNTHTIVRKLTDYLPSNFSERTNEQRKEKLIEILPLFLSNSETLSLGCLEPDNTITYLSTSEIENLNFKNCTSVNEQMPVYYERSDKYYYILGIYIWLGVGISVVLGGGLIYLVYRYGLLYIVFGNTLDKNEKA